MEGFGNQAAARGREGDPLDIKDEDADAAHCSSSELTIPGFDRLDPSQSCFGVAPLGEVLYLVWEQQPERRVDAMPRVAESHWIIKRTFAVASPRR